MLNGQVTCLLRNCQLPPSLISLSLPSNKRLTEAKQVIVSRCYYYVSVEEKTVLRVHNSSKKGKKKKVRIV